ncbi:PQQ-dependent sugar dehydrogenase [Parahaliea aestuarii]|uniref:PQQ-dependent sugar dehydrogenase n=1 Tax=Parahaliea aestuarii TaxID=1852021 RepID=UPI00164F5792|nr:PQQ-dependent sugar dehydrogenase [Parahaliea aestuarii]
MTGRSSGFWQALRRRTACLLLSAALAACGGGSGGSSSSAPEPPAPPPPGGEPAPGDPPFGLTERAPLATLRLPTEPIAGGSVGLERRFPALAFPSALFVAALPAEPRLVAVRQSGTLEVFASDNAAGQARTVLDLSERVLFAGEQGLLGLAFDPDFLANRYIYLHYSADNPRRSVISRFHWDAATDAVDPGSEKVILEVLQPFANHNGGMLAFGPDDYLYIALGDGGSGGDPLNNAQDTGNLLGSILRLDVHPADPAAPYAIPLDNPFVDNPAIRDEIWAYGLRNPFRFSFDRVTGLMWIGDVGQNALEEIDIASGGENFGWRVFEGSMHFDASLNTLPDAAFTGPVFEYGREQGVAVIGGYVYRGNAIPALAGRYIYSDFGSGNVWALRFDGQRAVDNELIARANAPTSLGEDSDGELLVVDRQGQLHGFTQSAGGNPPDRLSETGLFTDLASLAPASGLIEYTVNHAFWSDNTRKRRWLALPDGAHIAFDATGAWGFPVGSVTVKHFEILTREGDPASAVRLETRVMVRLEAGWEAFTYRWNTQGSDATLLSGRQTRRLQIEDASGGVGEQVYTFPSRTDCFRCHTAASGRVLGIHTAQLNRDFNYSGVTDNQLRSLNHIGLFDVDIGAAASYSAYPARDDSGAELNKLARAYLAVNCAACHREGGTAPVQIDLRFSTPLGDTGLIDQPPLASTPGMENAVLVAPGAPSASLLIDRVARRDRFAMPPLGSHLVDEAGVTLLSRWIESL